MPARTRKIRHDDETRAKIQAAQIINRFMSCLRGELELTQSQVSCGKALLAKVLPDLASIEHSGETNVRHVIADRPITADEWESSNCLAPTNGAATVTH